MRKVALTAIVAAAAFAEEKMTRFNFDSDTAGKPPKGFEFALTGRGRPGIWMVQAVNDAPSGQNVLAQTDGDDTDYRFPIAYTGPSMCGARIPAIGAGEAADVVAMKLEGDRLLIDLFHCKYAHAGEPAARIDDLYEVCGQAQKNGFWKMDVEKLFRHLRQREAKRLGRETRSEGGIEMAV